MTHIPVNHCAAGPVFWYKLRYIVGFWLVEMAISTNQKPMIYRNLYQNTGPELFVSIFHSFKAGIANAISVSKWRIIEMYMYLQNWIIWFTKHIPKTNNFSNIFFSGGGGGGVGLQLYQGYCKYSAPSCWCITVWYYHKKILAQFTIGIFE